MLCNYCITCIMSYYNLYYSLNRFTDETFKCLPNTPVMWNFGVIL